ncbi:helix-turn-helix domain-containing protein [Dehalococcoidia bacterium]|nr:helix-turn-helix domain-containing protein [Dehalococcoidia bacterium]
MQDTQKRTLTVTETAQILGIGRQSAYELARRGELPGVRRLGGRFIVSKAELETYLSGSSLNEK